MRIEDSFSVRAPVDAAWSFLERTENVARCLPGVERLTPLGENRYQAEVRVTVAYIQLKFDMELEIVEKVPPRRLVAKVTGRPTPLPGLLRQTIALELDEAAEGCRIAYATDVTLNGRLGSLGQSAFAAKAKQLSEAFAANVKAALEGDDAPAEAAAGGGSR